MRRRPPTTDVGRRRYALRRTSKLLAVKFVGKQWVGADSNLAETVRACGLRPFRVCDLQGSNPPDEYDLPLTEWRADKPLAVKFAAK